MNNSVNKAKEKVEEAEGKVKECEEILKKAQKDLDKAKDTLWYREKDLKDAEEKALAFDDFVSELKTYEEKMTKDFIDSKNKPSIFIRVVHWDGRSYGSDYCYYQAFDNNYPKKPYLWDNRTILQKDECRLDLLQEAVVGGGILIIVKTGFSVRYENFELINHLVALVIAFFYRDKEDITEAAEKTKETFEKVIYIKETNYDEDLRTEKSLLKMLYEKTFESST